MIWKSGDRLSEKLVLKQRELDHHLIASNRIMMCGVVSLSIRQREPMLRAKFCNVSK
ncbi:hypothetical protein [Bradyrhizobium sp. ARR65]|uniref:hypothetical protein n=1 Tax=Bradyrhizobium sp. ARR65 TaxID=1040989 RepID=UPI0012F87EAA|nr:hypothetical protein [Bradyrhizobium sp. ARR65]